MSQIENFVPLADDEIQSDMGMVLTNPEIISSQPSVWERHKVLFAGLGSAAVGMIVGRKYIRSRQPQTTSFA